MRLGVPAGLAALGLLLLPAAPALAAPSPGPVASAVPGQKTCSITDSKLSNITGLVATANGYAVVGSSSQFVTLLDNSCKQKGTPLKYPTKALSPQDIQQASDGTYWVADSANGDSPRPTIALWKMPAGGTGVIYRFDYPGDAHPDALAMVLSGAGTPVFVTKSTSGPAGVYVPNGNLDSSGKAVPLKKAGDFTPQRTGTAFRGGTALGNTVVTGGTVSPDGKKVVLRTYTDAYEWDVANGDVAGAIVNRSPRVTPLPQEPAGEAITFSRDGSSYLTLSRQTVSGSNPDVMLKYAPGKPGGGKQPADPVGAGAGTAPEKASTGGWFSQLTLQDITYLVAGVGVIGLIMVVGGVLGIRRARRQSSAAGRRPGVSGSAAVREGRADGYAPDGYGADGFGGDGFSGAPPGYGADPYGEAGYPPQRAPAPPPEYRSQGYGADYDYRAAPPPEENYRQVQYPDRSSGFAEGPPPGNGYPPGPPMPEAVPPRVQPNGRPRPNDVGRGTARPPSRSWADDHEGFGDLR